MKGHKIMKQITALLLAMTLLLCGCGSKAPAVDALEAPTLSGAVTGNPATEAPVEETTEPTTVPTTEPEVYFDPLNGEILDAPFDGRIYASTISNIRDALPHVGANQADILMEMFVNGSVLRCLALFTDIESVEAIGSVRSTRLMFNDIAQHYDAILFHAGGSSQVLGNAASRGIDHFNLDAWDVAKTGVSYRDKVYNRSLENSLFGVGSGIRAYAESQGVAMELEKDYGFRFAEDGNGTPAEGEAADKISWTMVYRQAKKDTSFVYDADLGKYV